MGQSPEELTSQIEDTRERMASNLDTLQDRVSPSAIVERRKLVGKQLYTLLDIARGDAKGMLRQFRKNFDFFDAPVGMILCVERRMGNGQWIDCGIFLDQLMLLAREKGLHTCPQAAFSRYQHIVRRELKIPDDQVVICGLALGQADPDAVPNNLITERAPLQDFTTWYDE